jgi:hypothetical protein
VARSRAGVPTGSGANATKVGGSQATRSCKTRGEGCTDKWAGPEGGAQPQREREEGREGDRWAQFSNLIQI